MKQLSALMSKLDSQAKCILETAANTCLSYKHYEIEINHWLLSLVENQANKNIINNLPSKNKQKIDLVVKLKNDILVSLEKNNKGNNQTPTISLNLIELIKSSWETASIDFHQDSISNSILLYTLLTHHTHSQIAYNISHEITELNTEKLKNQIEHNISQLSENTDKIERQNTNNSQDNQNSTLNKYAINLNQQAKLGKIDAVIGRDKEIQDTIETLCRRRQNNAILLGEPGVGKTAIVEGLALKIHAKQVPNSIENYIIYSLDMGLLLAGASVKGEFENRIKQIISEVKSSSVPIILFIDEAHSLIGAGNQQGQNDAANLLKPALARGELKCIAATTWAEYKKYFETDPALTRRFQAIKISEPTVDISCDILRSSKQQLENHHKVIILNQAIEQAVSLSNKYITERKLPDKAISVLDTACARVSGVINAVPYQIDILRNKIQLLNLEMTQLDKQKPYQDINLSSLIKTKKDLIINHQKNLYKLETQWQKEKSIIQNIFKEIEKINTIKNSKKNNAQLKKLKKQLEEAQGENALLHPFVDQYTIQQVITDWTGVPQSKLSQSESDKLLQLNQSLKQEIINQDHAIDIISASIKSARVGFSDPAKPLGIFLLAGPSGVGKTQTAEILAEQIFGSKNNMITINLSEYKEAHKVSTLAGAPPGYVGYGEGGVLTEAVRRQPYSLILLDEVEKAHPSIQDFFYQIFDKGIIKDSMGREISFKNTIIILTSNAASDFIIQQDNNSNLESTEFKQALFHELSSYFKPAFLGRVTTIPYLPLDQNALVKIATSKLEIVKNRAKINLLINLEFDKAVINLIIYNCQQNNLGARQIDQFIQHNIVAQLSELFLENIASNTNKNTNQCFNISLDKNNQIIISNKTNKPTTSMKKYEVANEA